MFLCSLRELDGGLKGLGTCHIENEAECQVSLYLYRV